MLRRPNASLWPLLLAAAQPLAAQEASTASPTQDHWQWAASAGADSDYRFRGVSLSGERATARLGVAADHTSGWYGGASLSAVRLGRGERSAQLLLYTGLARKLVGGFSWEVGMVGAHVDRASHYDYAELYAGLSAPHWNTRLYYSPDYFSLGWPSLYAELNGSFLLREPLRAFVHVGALSRLQQHGSQGQRTRYDARAGLSLSFESLQWQLAWVGASRHYPQAYGHRRHTLVLSVTTFF